MNHHFYSIIFIEENSDCYRDAMSQQEIKTSPSDYVRNRICIPHTVERPHELSVQPGIGLNLPGAGKTAEVRLEIVIESRTVWYY
jgi:hypothetical protein